MVNINFKGNGNIDFEGIRNLIASMEDDCRICDRSTKEKEGNLCNNCCMGSNSSYDEQRRRVYPGSIFKQFGLINLPAMGKHTLFWFLDREHLNFTFPDLPDEDLIGNVSEKRAIELGLNLAIKEERDRVKVFLWHIHHESTEFWNDREDNTMICLNTEHPWFGKKNKH
jgi:hypothetical protein